MKTCSIDGCEKQLKARGWCSMHHRRWTMHGDVTVCMTNRYTPMVERFWMKVQKGPSCWLWTAATGRDYGHFLEGYQGKFHLAHRFAYELAVGPIPDGMMLDHRCHNKLCVNPSHLRPVTRKQNRENVLGAPRNSSTGVRGVSYHPGKDAFVARVGHNKKRVHVGIFKTLAEAEAAVVAKRIELHTHNDADRLAAA